MVDIFPLKTLAKTIMNVKRENSVNSNYNEHNDDLFEDEITISELEQALKELPHTGSFDIENLHILILKHSGSRAKLVVLHLFNKKSYSECSSLRPLAISSHMGKLMERIISERLTLHCKRNNLIHNSKVSELSTSLPGPFIDFTSRWSPSSV